jgi:hypothetical protein
MTLLYFLELNPFNNLILVDIQDVSDLVVLFTFKSRWVATYGLGHQNYHQLPDIDAIEHLGCIVSLTIDDSLIRALNDLYQNKPNYIQFDNAVEEALNPASKY